VVEHFADEHRAAEVRHDKSHAPARFVVNEAVALVTKQCEKRHIGR
jgi:hypothetical protein